MIRDATIEGYGVTGKRGVTGHSSCAIDIGGTWGHGSGGAVDTILAFYSMANGLGDVGARKKESEIKTFILIGVKEGVVKHDKVVECYPIGDEVFSVGRVEISSY